MRQIIREIIDRELIGGEIAALGLLQEGEMSAVAAYDQAIQRVKDEHVMPILYSCRNSHALRAEILGVRLKAIGGTPRNSAGLIGGFITLVEGGAALLGKRPAVKFLSTVENIGTEQYQACMKSLAPDSWKIVDEELLPGQKKTDLTMHLVDSYIKGTNS
jgi:hypothetical protein